MIEKKFLNVIPEMSEIVYVELEVRYGLLRSFVKRVLRAEGSSPS